MVHELRCEVSGHEGGSVQVWNFQEAGGRGKRCLWMFKVETGKTYLHEHAFYVHGTNNV